MGWLQGLRRRAQGNRRATDPDADDLRWLHPPETTSDAAAWDRYWHDQLTHGVAGFVDMFCDDGLLVDTMRANGLRTILCVGSGVSQEPRALAAAGFDVTALDLSPLAIDVARRAEPERDDLHRLIGGRSPAGHGHVAFVAGDLCDPTVCPGPFDVIIERRTVQLFPDGDRDRALSAVAARLASTGIFFSHCHDGSWRPPAPRKHACEAWFAAQRWPRWHADRPVSGRVAWLFTSTG